MWFGDLDQPNLLLRLEHDPAAAFSSIYAKLVQATGYTTGNNEEAVGYIHLNAVLDTINDMINDHDVLTDWTTEAQGDDDDDPQTLLVDHSSSSEDDGPPPRPRRPER